MAATDRAQQMKDIRVNEELLQACRKGIKEYLTTPFGQANAGVKSEIDILGLNSFTVRTYPHGLEYPPTLFEVSVRIKKT